MLLLEKDSGKKFKSPIFFATVFITLAFVLILARLGYLQLIQGSMFKNRSENNRIRIRKIPHPRGIILDRKGRVLVDNYPSFDLSIILEDVPDLPEVVQRLCTLLNLETGDLNQKIAKSKGRPPFLPTKLKTNLNREDLAVIETNRLDLPGIIIEIEPKRRCLFDNLAAHIIGHMGKISKAQLRTQAYAGYTPMETVGKQGVEHEFESTLRGKDGGRRVEVDAAGREVSLLSEVEPTPGNNIFLTIDLEIQTCVEALLGENIGCAILMDPNNGEILALVSSPSFNPNLFSRGLSYEAWEKLLNHPDHPLENKAIQGQYPPASVFKIITAVAALEEGIITPETQFVCRGSLPFGRRNYRCWKKSGHGRIKIHRALVESCDIYFYNLGERLDIDTLASYSYAFGLGRLTTVSLSNEKPGLVPTRDWKLNKLQSRWQRGETLSVAIGQSFLLATPIQMLDVITSIATSGTLYRPQIIKRIETPDGKILTVSQPRRLGIIPASQKNLALVRNALHAAVDSPKGSGRRAQIPGVKVGGKTGTAQVVRLPQKRSSSATPHSNIRLRDHAWFVAFAPVDDPKLSVVVMIEHGGQGGTVAAPIAREILKQSLAILQGEELLRKTITRVKNGTL